jgi:ribose/xylose/arabinose/galactoside ABC-type transport system permease subunit
VLILQVLDNGLNLSGLESFYRYIATGLILIAAVVIDQLFPDLF